MSKLEFLHFEQLKKEIQAQYLKNHTPSNEDISKWKGIDIIYFQEDLRKMVKGNISEKSFYTYFKAPQNNKTPRIDMLNLLSNYAGYVSWYDFKKNHLFANEVLTEEEEVADLTYNTDIEDQPNNSSISISENNINPEKTLEISATIGALEKRETNIKSENTKPTTKNENQTVFESYDTTEQISLFSRIKKYVWASITAILAILTAIFGFGDKIFGSHYVYNFRDADRNTPIPTPLNIKVEKENESPLYFRIEPGKSFVYPTKDKVLNMEISSPLYENLKVHRNLENAPEEENILLKSDDYKTAVYYYSKKGITGNPDESMTLIKQKRKELENRISDKALIYQVFDNDIYGIETLDKQKYITLVTTPTTSLKNLSVIDMKMEKGKIVLIRFKIKEDDEIQ